MRLLSVRVPLKLLGTGKRHTQFQVLPIKITEELAKNQKQLGFLSIKLFS